MGVITLECGTILNETYRVVKKLGEGSEGCVYLVIHERTCGLGAVKVIPRSKVRFADSQMMHRLQLAHPGLPKITDIWSDEQSRFVVMEYIEGTTLAELQKRSGKQSRKRIITWMLELCEILEYLHKCNPPIIYSDMKPDNIICRKDGSLVLTDFGSMRRADSANPILTGTKGYAAPEQYESAKNVTPQTDIYSLGKTMQAMYGGTDRDLIKILKKCTKTLPRKRYHSCSELRAKLIQRKHKKVRYLLGSAAMSVLVMGTAVFAAEREQKVKQQEVYTQYINSNDISKIKSAIILNPYREEAYHKLLEQILEDYKMENEEEAVLRQIVVENEPYLKNDEKAYGAFIYQLGVAYWYYFNAKEGKIRAAAWFEKAVETVGLTAEENERSILFGEIGTLYERLASKAVIGQGVLDYSEVWRNCKRLSIVAKHDDILQMQIWNEVLTITYSHITAFLYAGISVSELQGLVEEIHSAAASISVEELALQELKAELTEKYERLMMAIKAAAQRAEEGIHE